MAKLMLGVLFLTLVAMVITGFGTGGSGLGGMGGVSAGTVATVGGEEISSERLRQETQRQFERIRAEQPELDLAAFLNRGAMEEVLAQLIDVAAANQFARAQGLGVSRTMIDRDIAGIRQFHDVTGRFDDATFRQVLAREGLTEQQLREDFESRLIQRQLVLPAAGSAYVPDAIANRYASLLLESRTGIVGAVPTAAMGVGAEPSDAELAAFYKSNLARYTIPERRVIRYAVFGPEQVAAQTQASEAEIQAAYRRNPAYAARETRSLSQVVLQQEAAARALAQKVAAGTSFAAAAAAQGRSAADIALGINSREAFAAKSSPEVAAAAFAAAKGATIGPVKSRFGWHVVKVDDIIVSPARPLDAVRGEIAASIQQQKSLNAVADLAGRIENSIDDGSSFEEVVAANKLQLIETPPVTAAGAAPGDAGWQIPADLKPLLDPAFAMEPGEDPGVETIQENQRFALVAVGRTVPAAAPALAQIRDRVKADLIVRRASDRARAVASAIAAKINAGTAPAAAFAQAQVKLPAVQTITATRREIAQRNAEVPPPMAMLFSLPRGKARILAAPDGRGWFVVHLAQIVPGDARSEPGLIEAVRGQFATIIGDEYAQQLTASIRAGMKIKRNDEAVRQLRKEMLGPGAGQ
jgi:peptidyl-prolyl cis-trans isomerase D